MFCLMYKNMKFLRKCKDVNETFFSLVFIRTNSLCLNNSVKKKLQNEFLMDF